MPTVPVLLKWIGEALLPSGYALGDSRLSLVLDTNDEPAACQNQGYFRNYVGQTYDAASNNGTLSITYPDTTLTPPADPEIYRYFKRIDIDVPDGASPIPTSSGIGLTDYDWSYQDVVYAGGFEGSPLIEAFGGFPSNPANVRAYFKGSAPIVKPATHPGTYVATYSIVHTTSSEVTYSHSWRCCDVYIDGALYQAGIRDAQMRINGTIFNFTVTETEVARYDYEMGELNGTPGAGPAGSSEQFDLRTVEFVEYLCEGECTVTHNVGAVEFRYVHSLYGVNYQWCLSHLKPVADLDVTSDGNGDISMDAGDSYTIDSPISTYRFVIANGGTTYVDITQAGATLDADISGIVDDDVTVTITVTVTDVYGCAATASRSVPVEALRRIGAVLHPGGPLITAAKIPGASTGVTVCRFDGAAAGRQDLAFLSGRRDPSIHLDKTGRLILMATNAASADTFVSLDLGETFTAL